MKLSSCKKRPPSPCRHHRPTPRSSSRSQESTKSDRSRPKPHPSLSRFNSTSPTTRSARCLKRQRAPTPSHPSNCACGTLKVARSRDACEAGSSLYPDEAEIAEAIAHTFRRLRTKPTTLNINMFRSRRLSRSVPDLLSPHGKSRSASARKGQNVGEEEEGEERDEDDLELHKTRRQNGKRGRQKQKDTSRGVDAGRDRRIYENLQSDPYYYARERAPMMPPSAFSYASHFAAHAHGSRDLPRHRVDETKTRRSHESTTVRIAVRKE
nr:hypothetical protein BaRGS_024312 [Batillaria attramentaria]